MRSWFPNLHAQPTLKNAPNMWKSCKLAISDPHSEEYKRLQEEISSKAKDKKKLNSATIYLLDVARTLSDTTPYSGKS